jgi:hypothetical protein
MGEKVITFFFPEITTGLGWDKNYENKQNCSLLEIKLHKFNCKGIKVLCQSRVSF